MVNGKRISAGTLGLLYLTSVANAEMNSDVKTLAQLVAEDGSMTGVIEEGLGDEKIWEGRELQLYLQWVNPRVRVLLKDSAPFGVLDEKDILEIIIGDKSQPEKFEYYLDLGLDGNPEEAEFSANISSEVLTNSQNSPNSQVDKQKLAREMYSQRVNRILKLYSER